MNNNQCLLVIQKFFFRKIYFEFQYFLIVSGREMRLNIIAK